MHSRPSKKTETIEIRLSPELKSALSDLSQGRGHSMSEMVRTMIEGEVGGWAVQPSIGASEMTLPTSRRFVRAIAFALPVLALGLIYALTAQSPAVASEEARVYFAELDADADARVTLPEISAFLTEDGWQPDPVCGTDAAGPDEPCTLAAMAEMQLNRVDSDRDGAVSFSELSAVLLRDRAADFLDMDFDENGFLSADELAGAELYWLAEEPELAEEDGIVLSEACRSQLLAEDVTGIAETCGFANQARIEIAIFDVDRDGRVSLMEWLSE
ncbi:MAG: hypothetical protein AAF689_17760 [Pseudomonadota bacterium]